MDGFIMENPIKMGWFGGTTILGNPQMLVPRIHQAFKTPWAGFQPQTTTTVFPPNPLPYPPDIASLIRVRAYENPWDEN